MFREKKLLNKLIEEGVKKGYVLYEDVIKVSNNSEDEFDGIIDILEKNNITLLYDESKEPINLDNDFYDFLNNLEDKDFVEFNEQIEKDLSRDFLDKNLDEMLPNISSNDDPVRMYIKEIGVIPLLGPNKEIELARIIRKGLEAESKLEEITKSDSNSDNKFIEELKNQIADAEEARELLIHSNLKLVVSVAKKFMNNGLPLQDLIQEGNMGLLKMINKFDPEKGFKFSTYATWWIKQSITRAISDQARTIRIPVHVGDFINRMLKAQKKLTQILQREPTVPEIAEEMGENVNKIYQIQYISQEPISLEKAIGEDEESTLGDFISDNSILNPLEYTIYEEFKEELEKLLKGLQPKEEKIIRLRYGLDGGRPHTLEEVGREFNVTRERIRQIEAKAIRYLRHPTRQKVLRPWK